MIGNSFDSMSDIMIHAWVMMMDLDQLHIISEFKLFLFHFMDIYFQSSFFFSIIFFTIKSFR